VCRTGDEGAAAAAAAAEAEAAKPKKKVVYTKKKDLQVGWRGFLNFKGE
jgi:hypothetical protein